MEVLTLNGKPLSDFNCYFDGSRSFGKAEKDVEFVEVPGRNGDISYFNNRYRNLEVVFPCFIRENFKESFRALMNYVSSFNDYIKIETSTERETYRMGQFVSLTEPTTGSWNKNGAFDLVFYCKPQKFLKTGDIAIPITGNRTLRSPYYMEAKPLLNVYGTGTIGINDSVLVLSRNTGNVWIDCEIQDAWQGSINRNPNLTVTGGWPLLKYGDNVITISGCTFDLYPRWWQI